jgi:hypothetical protein
MTSEGEKYIESFLKHEKIKYRKEQHIEGLLDDSKSHRKADFYLPKYKVYIEFFGQWNVPEQRERYLEKRKVYISNQIPCVILYPENLGIIGYVFPKRMLFVLGKYKMERELKNFKWKLMWRDKSHRFSYSIIAIATIVYQYPWAKDNMWLYASLATLVYQSYCLNKEYKQLFADGEIFTEYLFEK